MGGQLSNGKRRPRVEDSSRRQAEPHLQLGLGHSEPNWAYFYPSWPGCGQVVWLSGRKKRSSRTRLSGNLKPKTPHAIHNTNTEGLKHPAVAFKLGLNLIIALPGQRKTSFEFEKSRNHNAIFFLNMKK